MLKWLGLSQFFRKLHLSIVVWMAKGQEASYADWGMDIRSGEGGGCGAPGRHSGCALVGGRWVTETQSPWEVGLGSLGKSLLSSHFILTPVRDRSVWMDLVLLW